MEGMVYPHRDLAACTSMSLNSSSSLAMLAGRRHFGLVDLTNPANLVYKETRQSKWEVIVSEWSPLEDKLVAVGSNSKVELLTWTESELVLVTSLRSHTRVITDLSWHTHDRQLLATSAADTYIYLWDMRDLRRPKMGLQAVAGAAKVQFNKVSGKYLASAHEGEVKLWDIRHSSSPVLYINAHLSRIYDLDWSVDQEDCLVTSSQDKTVQLWNLASPSKAENTMKMSGAPVWRLQHTPFGSGLLTLVMPHTLHRGEMNNLVLWNRQDLRAPVHTFYGHTDIVVNFGWTFNNQQAGGPQLVTWSKDSTLRMWNIDPELRRKCGQEVEEVEELKQPDLDVEDCQSGESEFFECKEVEELGGRRSGPAVLEEDQGAVMISSSASVDWDTPESSIGELPNIKNKSMNLNYEFSLINLSDKLEVVAQDAKERLFTVSAETAKNVLILHVKFPLNYPNQKAPIFSFLHGTTVDHLTRSGILGKLRVVAKQQINRNRRCLEPCLRQFEASVGLLKEAEEEQIQVNNPQFSHSAILGGFQDNIPFPRSSGARFCGDGNLVCFGYTRQYKVLATAGVDQPDGEIDPDSEIAKTPRALSALGMVNVGTVSILGSGATSPKYSMVGMSLCGQSPQTDNPYFPFKARVPRVRFSTQKSRVSVSSISSEDVKSDRKISSGSTTRLNQGTVTIYSCSALLPYNKMLATKYLVPGSSNMSLADICQHNATACQQADRPDLVQLWSLAALTASSAEETTQTGDCGTPWAQHPMGRLLVMDLMEHYLGLSDVQTVAVLCAVFSNRMASDPSVAPFARKKNSKSESVRVDSATDALATRIKHTRSNSDNPEESGKTVSTTLRKFSFASSEADDEADSCMLDPTLNHVYDRFILHYADLLYRWRMLIPRAELIKCLSQPHRYGSYLTNVTISCRTCRHPVRGPKCLTCLSLTLHCSLCRLPCRGQTCVCALCGHGGHTAHILDWFHSHPSCPTGCGCPCSSQPLTWGM